MVEKYWELGPSSVCMTCCGIGHEQMGKCRDRNPRCVIYAGPHKLEDHLCGVIGCHKGKGKMCIHVKVQCANCGGGHSANSNRCTKRHKAEVDARKNKLLSKGKAKMVESNDKRAYGEATFSQDEASPNQKETSPEPEANSSLDEASSGPNEVISNPNMGMDLAPEWAEYEEKEGFDHDEIPEGINHSKKF